MTEESGGANLAAFVPLELLMMPRKRDLHRGDGSTGRGRDLTRERETRLWEDTKWRSEVGACGRYKRVSSLAGIIIDVC